MKFIKNTYNKILDFIKRDLGIEYYLKEKEKIKNNISKHINSINKINKKLLIVTKEKNEILNNEVLELKNSLLKFQKSYDKNKLKILKCEKKYCFLLSDDNSSSILLMENDLKFILGLPSLVENEISDNIVKEKNNLLLKLKNSVNLNTDNTSIIKISGENSPLNIILSLLNGLKIDYAVLDIIFGGLIEINNKRLFIDGIDVAEFILDMNNKAVIIFYTGCDLNETTEEYNKLSELKKVYPDQIFIVDKDINDENRINTFINSFKSFYKIQGNINESIK